MANRHTHVIPAVATLVVAAYNSPNAEKLRADYVCDGTADNVEIQAALNALPTTGGRIVLTDGRFNLAATVRIRKSNTVLEGQNSGSLLFMNNSLNTEGIQIGDGSASYSHITVRNLKLDGNMANQTSGNGIKIFSLVAHAEVSGCHVRNTSWANIYDDGGTYTVIRNNYCDTTSTGNFSGNIEGVGDYGLVEGNICLSGDGGNLYLYNGSNSVGQTRVVGNYCVSAGANSDGAISFDNDYSVISNNIILGSASSGIMLTGGGNMVSSNVIMNSAVSAIVNDQFSNSMNSNYIVVRNNPSAACIVLSVAGDVVGNHFSVTSAGNTEPVTGVFIDNHRCTVTNNTFHFDTSEAHIALYNDQNRDQLVIANNQMIFLSKVTGSHGMLFEGGIFESNVTGNVIYNANVGIESPFSDYNSFVNNTLAEVDKGFILDSGTYGKIDGNLVMGTTSAGEGILLTDMQIMTVNNNTVFGFGHDGIEIGGCFDVTVTGNHIADNGNVATDTYSGILITSFGGGDSGHLVITGNSILGAGLKYGIRETDANQGPNIVTSNIVTGAVTAQISTQHASTVSANNITS